MTAQEQTELDSRVADLFTIYPGMTIAAACKLLGRTRWEITVSCYRAGIPLKVGRPRKNKAKVT